MFGLTTLSGSLVLLNVCGLVAFSIGQYRNGKVKKNSDEIATANSTIDLLQKSVDVLEKNLAEERNLRLKDHDDLIAVQRDLVHAKEENNKLMKILENRSPDLEKILTSIQVSLDKLNFHLETK